MLLLTKGLDTGFAHVQIKSCGHDVLDFTKWDVLRVTVLGLSPKNVRHPSMEASGLETGQDSA